MSLLLTCLHFTVLIVDFEHVKSTRYIGCVLMYIIRCC